HQLRHHGTTLLPKIYWEPVPPGDGCFLYSAVIRQNANSCLLGTAQSLRKAGIDLGCGAEGLGICPLHHKEHSALKLPRGLQLRQLLYMPCPPRGDSIREEGSALLHQRAALHFQKQLFSPIVFQEKVEAEIGRASCRERV